MAKLDIKSANFAYKSISLFSNNLFIDDKIVNEDDIEFLNFASEENVKKVAGSVGWGVAGAATFGLLGAAAGLLFGGNKKETTFIVQMKGGKSFIASTASDSFLELQKKINQKKELVQACVINKDPSVVICSSNFKLDSVKISASGSIFIDNKMVCVEDIDSVSILDVVNDDKIDEKGVFVDWMNFDEKVIDNDLVITAWFIGNLSDSDVIFMISINSGKKLIAKTDKDTVTILQKVLSDHKGLVDIVGDSYVSVKSFSDLTYYE